MVNNLQCNNNIFKSQNYYEGTEWIFHNSAGFWADTLPSPVYASYSCVYWGNPPPPGGPSQTHSYLNMIVQDLSTSYNQNDLIDPDFDYTPGDNYYHPQNSTVATGGLDGCEMGCFGGSDGEWLPPSQIYN